MKVIFLTLFIICISTSTLYSQFTNVRISNINQPHETSIMVNPFNTDIIVAAANIYTANSLSGYFYSSNAGLNWSGGILNSNIVMPFGDVVVIVDTSEHFYILQNSNYQALMCI